jgi:hypothetical protein
MVDHKDIELLPISHPPGPEKVTVSRTWTLIIASALILNMLWMSAFFYFGIDS